MYYPIGECGEESIRETLQYLSSPNVLANLLAEIQVPIHCVNKAHTKTNLDVVRKYNPNISASSIENVGHFFLWDAPDEFNKLLENAIEDFKSEEE